MQLAGREYWFVQAQEAQRAGKCDEAVQIYEQVLGIDASSKLPLSNFDSLACAAASNLATLYRQSRRPVLARDLLRAVAPHLPYVPEVPFNLGNALLDLQDYGAASAAYESALRLRPLYPKAALQLAFCYHNLGRHLEAEQLCRRTLSAVGDQPELLHLLGVIMAQTGRSDEALPVLKSAAQLQPTNPLFHFDLGVVCGYLDRLAEAVGHLQKAIQLKPDYADAFRNLGNIYTSLGKFENAEGCIMEALRLNANLAEAHVSLGMLRLLQGDFERGWPAYEWRWHLREYAPRSFPKPLWDGSSLAGRTILLHVEQGLGDSLQFIRYAPLLKQLGATVFVGCQPNLLRLIARCPGVDQVFGAEHALPPYDVHAPLLSLPGLFKTTIATIPVNVPYLLADEALRRQWKRELSSLPDFKVGISWQGSLTHPHDRRRSVTLTRFAGLADVQGVRLFSVQKGPGSDQLRQAADRGTIKDLGGATSDDFLEMAAVVANLDLIITVDTALAHLAGGLGVPVWVALPFAPDWRWLLGRDDSPWYPTMRLFRQTEPGNWDGVFARIREALKKLVNEPAGLSCRGTVPL